VDLVYAKHRQAKDLKCFVESKLFKVEVYPLREV